VPVFVLAEAALYLGFFCGDLAGSDTTGLKYAAIILCALFSALWWPVGGDKLVTVALFFTVAADTFLLVLDDHYLTGVLLFCVVQGLYLVRICIASGHAPMVLLRLVLLALALGAMSVLGLLNLLNAAAAFYFVNFLSNVAESLGLRGRRYRLFSVGLVLFLCCDLLVGIFNQRTLFSDQLFAAARVGMWLFYLPGQVLIVLSGLPEFLYER
jgi:hypothetical protein